MSDVAADIWNQVAPSWLYHMRHRPEAEQARERLLLPTLLELIGPAGGRRVLDAGCGEGFLSRILARQGATVTGVDVSTDLLGEARREEEREPLGVNYFECPVADLQGAEGFDVVVSSLVLPVVADYKGAIREASRALKTGGLFVAALTHPCFDGVGPGWVRRASGEDRWSANRYAAHVEGRAAHGAPVYHRPLSHYIETAFESGLVLTAFREPVPGEDYSCHLPPEERLFDLVPALVFLRFQKTDGPLAVTGDRYEGDGPRDEEAQAL
jgi:SAM-dependent methyltransferase